MSVFRGCLNGEMAWFTQRPATGGVKFGARGEASSNTEIAPETVLVCALFRAA